MGARRYRYHLAADPGSGRLWFHVPLRGGWTVCYRLIPRDGRAVVAELRVLPSPVESDPKGEPVGHPDPPGVGVTAGLLKDHVVLGRHLYELLPAALRAKRGTAGGSRVEVREGTEVRTMSLIDALVGSLGFKPGHRPRRGRRGPKAWSDRTYAEIAAYYVARQKAGSKTPAKDAAQHYDVTPAALKSTLARARRKGLLTRAGVGRSGGRLTPRARALLRPATRPKKKPKRGANQ